MAYNDPQQELFTALKLGLESLKYDVYDTFLPPEDTPYPFIYLGDVQQSDSATKSKVNGNVYVTIHVWHNNPKQRGTVSKMLLDVKSLCRHIEQTTNFAWTLRDVNQRIFADNTTKTPLLHGVIEAGFYFS